MTIDEAASILGVSRGDSMESVGARRKLLLMAFHPDRFVDGTDVKEDAEEEMKKINAAYDVIKEAVASGEWGLASNSSSSGSSGQAEHIAVCTCGRKINFGYKVRLDKKADVSDLIERLYAYAEPGTATDLPLAVFTYIDNTDDDEPDVMGCTACTCCVICKEPLNAFEWIEDQEKLVDVRGPTISDMFWYGTKFDRMHVGCYELGKHAARENEKRRKSREDQARREERESRMEKERARSEERDRRRANSLCLECGKDLSLLDKLGSRDTHKTCGATSESESKPTWLIVGASIFGLYLISRLGSCGSDAGPSGIAEPHVITTETGETSQQGGSTPAGGGQQGGGTSEPIVEPSGIKNEGNEADPLNNGSLDKDPVGQIENDPLKGSNGEVETDPLSDGGADPLSGIRSRPSQGFDDSDPLNSRF